MMKIRFLLSCNEFIKKSNQFLYNDLKFMSVKDMYFKIDQHLAWFFVYYVECLLSPPPFLCSQIVTPFLNSMFSTNQEKGFKF